MIYTVKYHSPIGEMLLTEENGALIGAWFYGQEHLAAGITAATVMNQTPLLMRMSEWLDRYFIGLRPDIHEILVAPAGNEFQQTILNIIREIPYGCVTTYGSIACEAAKRRGLAHMAAQAIGSALGHNPISVLIPCHRVVGAEGCLTGYAAGLVIKRALLMQEGLKVDTDRINRECFSRNTIMIPTGVSADCR